jgi:muconolactone delta-isomerase
MKTTTKPNHPDKQIIDDIRNRGWYRKGQTFAAGGWGEVYKFASNWRTYILTDSDPNGTSPEIDQITAKDDKAAKAGFEELYNISETDSIWERKTRHRLVRMY